MKISINLLLVSVAAVALPSAVEGQYVAATGATPGLGSLTPTPKEYGSFGRMSVKDCVIAAQKFAKNWPEELKRSVGFTKIDNTKVQCYAYGYGEQLVNQFVDHDVEGVKVPGLFARVKKDRPTMECSEEQKAEMIKYVGADPNSKIKCGYYGNPNDVTWYALPKEPIQKESGPKPKPSATGDPHFETWSGEKYDFHGGCDLVLLQNNHFANGLGMNIHVRTSIRTWWSYIETAILQLGDNTLQIKGGKTGSIKCWINGEEKELETGNSAMGDFAIAFRRIKDHQSQTRVDLGNRGDAISIETFKDFVKVNVKNVKDTNFEGSVGMLGAYPDGKKVGRDGKTIFEDVNAFGQEWMVKPSDKVLFTDVDMDDFPLQCTMPDAASAEGKRRRLGESDISEQDAAIACSRVDEAHRDACIFDVMATLDLDMAGSY